MTEEELQQIRERAEKATPGPWHGKLSEVFNDTDSFSWIPNRDYDDVADTVFIAHAREDIPALLAEVERLRNRLSVHRNALQKCADDTDRLEAENAAMREIVQAVVAGAAPCTVIDEQCHLLGSCEPEWEGPVSPAGYWKHHPDCPVTKARAILAETDAK